MPFTYDYPRPAVVADCIILKKDEQKLEILLVKRKNDPYADCWALPGGFLEMDEEIPDCAKRELQEETGLSGIELNELFTVGTINRDPRGRVISVIYYGFASHHAVKAGDDAAEVKWFSINMLPELAFDHNEVIDRGLKMITEAGGL